jgi:putative transposase
MQLDPQLYKFYGDRIRVSVRPREFLFINLKFGEYQKSSLMPGKRGSSK